MSVPRLPWKQTVPVVGFVRLLHYLAEIFPGENLHLDIRHDAGCPCAGGRELIAECTCEELDIEVNRMELSH